MPNCNGEIIPGIWEAFDCYVQQHKAKLQSETFETEDQFKVYRESCPEPVEPKGGMISNVTPEMWAAWTSEELETTGHED